MISTLKTKLLLFVALAGLCGATPAHAVWPWDSPENDNTIRYRLSVAANTSTAAVVIDLSDTTNFPHKQTRALNINSIRIELDKVAASTCSVKLGVVNMVNPSTGSVTWFYNKSHEVNVSNTDIRDFLNYVPNYIPCRVNKNADSVDGSTPYILSNDTTSGSTIYQTDVNLPSPLAAGTTKPGTGDVVMSVQTGGATVVNLTIQYSSEK